MPSHNPDGRESPERPSDRSIFPKGRRRTRPGQLEIRGSSELDRLVVLETLHVGPHFYGTDDAIVMSLIHFFVRSLQILFP